MSSLARSAVLRRWCAAVHVTLAIAVIASCTEALAGAPPQTDPLEPVRPAGIVGPSAPCTLVRVIDGDTVEIEVGGAREKARLLALDTEETFASSKKLATAFGRATSAWAKELLIAGQPCWIEQGPERRDVYDRLLAYLWRKDGDAWRLYNVEAVERGFSPYFTKYGFSREHHAALAAAEQRAQSARVGIWDPTNAGALRGRYLGPGGLRELWDERARALETLARIAPERLDLLDLRSRYAEARTYVGHVVTVFTALRRLERDGDAWIGKCEGKPREPFAIVATSGDESVGAALVASLERYRYFTGTIERSGGRGLRLRLASAADIHAEPPPTPTAPMPRPAGRPIAQPPP